VQHARTVRRLDRAGDLHADAQRLGDRERVLPRAELEVGPRAVLHHQVGAAVAGDTRLVDRDDRGMRRQHRHHVRLVGELLRGPAGDAVGEQHLHRDTTTRHLLLVQEDVGESAGAQGLHIREAGELRRR